MALDAAYYRLRYLSVPPPHDYFTSFLSAGDGVQQALREMSEHGMDAPLSAPKPRPCSALLTVRRTTPSSPSCKRAGSNRGPCCFVRACYPPWQSAALARRAKP
ncbi:unnamed protein product [Symbiodinium natans]|uniref:Uncharacterized protein n=1 Tax=Symbiodinium natans TaxID=878477 RepID=A0A812Q5A7_9DINO|nr:unnamed protein product [Symbiodinium natans]